MEFINLFTLYLKQLIELGSQVAMVGDVNLNLLNPNKYGYIDIYTRNMFEIGMTPLITLPTKVNLENPITWFSILNQIWVTSGLDGQHNFVIPLDITDHFPVDALFSLKVQVNQLSFKKRPFLPKGRETFATLLSNIQVGAGWESGDIFDSYFKKIFECHNIASPLLTCSAKSGPSAPWMTHKLKQCIKKKAKLYKLYLKGRIAKASYTVYKNRLTNSLRKAKRNYHARLFMEVANDFKRIWLSLNSIMNNKKKRSLKEVKVNNIILIGRDLADYANNYFVNAADSVTNGIQFPDIFTCYVPRINSICFFFPTDYRKVLSVILSLKNKGSNLLDIHPVIIKENKEITADHSEQLYNLALIAMMFPNALKTARVIPANKSGPIDIMDNFRPISALPVFSKIFEKLTYKRMENFAVTHNILSACQFGFHRGRSTTLAIAKLISLVVKAFHQKIYCASIFLYTVHLLTYEKLLTQ